MYTIIVLILVCLIFYKYHIDTKLTIKELNGDKNKYRSQMWRIINDRDRQVKHINNLQNPYNDIKIKVNKLRDDLKETEFSDFDNIKEEIISALDQIDFYGDPKND
jgi:hypothetical protein